MVGKLNQFSHLFSHGREEAFPDGIEPFISPWHVVSIDFDQLAGGFGIHIDFRSGSRFLCP